MNEPKSYKPLKITRKEEQSKKHRQNFKKPPAWAKTIILTIN
jgi:hypothetical protein